MKKTKKRLKMVLFVGLLVMLIRIPASAASNTVAKIGSKSYTSLDAAIEKVKNGQTITLQQDVTYSSKLTVNRSGISFTLDLNKHTITFKNNAFLYLKKGSFTLKNGTIIQKNITGYAMKIAKAGTLTIASGTYTGLISNAGTMTVKKGNLYSQDRPDSYAGYYLITNTGTLKINAGTYNCRSYQMLNNSGKVTIVGGTFEMPFDSSWEPITNTEQGTISIKGGTFTSSESTIGYMIHNSGKLTISGGSFTSSRGILSNSGTAQMKGAAIFEGASYGYVLYNSGKMVISGGSFTSTAATAIYCAWEDEINLASSLTIKGGTFTFTSNFLSAIKATVKITGGTFKMKKAGTLFTAERGSQITVTGGTFTAKKGYIYSIPTLPSYADAGDAAGIVTITGGTFNTKAATA